MVVTALPKHGFGNVTADYFRVCTASTYNDLSPVERIDAALQGIHNQGLATLRPRHICQHEGQDKGDRTEIHVWIVRFVFLRWIVMLLAGVEPWQTSIGHNVRQWRVFPTR